MKDHFNFLKIVRNNVLKTVEGLSLSAINQIPKGFNNNIAWNMGHLVATQQLLCYALSGEAMYVDNEFVNKYRKGSKPEGDIDQTELDFIKNQMIVLVDKIEDDYSNNLFKNYKEYTTSFDATLRKVEDAIVFNNIHEGVHLGYIFAQKRALGV